jgi:hypothetical protein
MAQASWVLPVVQVCELERPKAAKSREARSRQQRIAVDRAPGMQVGQWRLTSLRLAARLLRVLRRRLGQ